jgi:hypothetical protein
MTTAHVSYPAARSRIDPNAGVWLLMVSAVGIHVIDEALTGFLPFYNAQVIALRARLGFFPAPTFTFGIWLTGLALAVAIGFALTGAVHRGGKAVRVVCGVLAALMIANACGHMLGSLYFGRILPGFWSSPWLLVTSVWMVTRVVRGNWRQQLDKNVRRLNSG